MKLIVKLNIILKFQLITNIEAIIGFLQIKLIILKFKIFIIYIYILHKRQKKLIS